MNRPTTPGNLTRVGSGAPASGLGQNGDVYIDELTGRHWEKVGGSWGLMFQPTLPASKITGTLPSGSLAGYPWHDADIAADAAINPAKFLNYPSDQAKYLKGNGSWGVFAADVQAQTKLQGEIWNGAAPQTIVSATWTSVALASAYFPAVGVSYASSAITFGALGLWLAFAYVQWTPNSSGSRLMAINMYNQGGVLADQIEIQAKADGIGEPMSVFWLFNSTNVSQFLVLQVYQASGVNLDVQVAKLGAVRVSS